MCICAILAHHIGAILGWVVMTCGRAFVMLAENIDREVLFVFDPKILDDIADRFSNALPSGLKDIQADLEKNVRSAVQTGLSKLDLVTREEFDVQTQVLAKTRNKLEALEKKVAELEAQKQ